MSRQARPSRRVVVEWVELRRRMELLAQALDAQAALSPERARDVLEARARALAHPAAAAREDGGLEVVVFTLGNEEYALESRFVFEVFRPVAVARLPGAEPPVVGVTAWRGELLRVLDLVPLLDLQQVPSGLPRLVVVLGDDRPAFGFLADTMMDITRLETRDIRPSPQAPGVGREILRGMTSVGASVLDAAALLRRYSSAR